MLIDNILISKQSLDSDDHYDVIMSNIDNLNEYNRSLRDLQELFETSVEDSILLDTSSMSMDEVSVEIASQIMTAMR